MTEQDYLLLTRQTANDRTRFNSTYLVFGLCSEAGELADLKKKELARDETADFGNVLAELGDILWYFTRLCDTYSLTPEQIRDANAAKLQARQAQGTLVSREGRTDPRSYGP